MTVRTLFRSNKPKMIKTTDESSKALLPDITVEAPLPDMTFLPGSRDVNIVLMVKEHVPTRLKEIENELQAMQYRREKLEQEAKVLTRLAKAVEEE